MVPNGLKFAESHEWVKLEDKIATIGLSQYAVEQLGDIVFLELPAIGTDVKGGDPFATVESVKAASDIYTPVTGKVVEVNTELDDAPEKVNQDCFGDGWLCKIEITQDIQSLMDSAEYEKYIEGM